MFTIERYQDDMICNSLVDEECFNDIFLVAWFCASTITTVGYGDMVPSTAAGRFVSIAMCMFGVILLCIMSTSVNHFLSLTPKGSLAHDVYNYQSMLHKLDVATPHTRRHERRKLERKVALNQDEIDGKVERRLERLETMLSSLDNYIRQREEQ